MQNKETISSASRNEIYRKAIIHFGEAAQMIKACEEMAELIQALAKVYCVHSIAATQAERHEAWDHVYEELADAEIMLEQLRLIFEGSATDDIKDRKVRRLAEMLGLKEYKAPARPPADPAAAPDDWCAQLGGDE